MHTPFELMYGRYSTHYIFIRPFNATQIMIFVLELIVCAGTLLYNMTRFPYMPHLMYAFIICNGMGTYIFIITCCIKSFSCETEKQFFQ
jgi:hypothetical protein